MRISNELTVVGFKTLKDRERFIFDASEPHVDENIHFHFDDLLNCKPEEQDDLVPIDKLYQSGPVRFLFRAREDWKSLDIPGGQYEELSVSYHFYSYSRPAKKEARLLSGLYPDVMFILYISPGDVKEFCLSVFRGGKTLYDQSIKYEGLTDPFLMMHFNVNGLPWWRREDIHTALLGIIG